MLISELLKFPCFPFVCCFLLAVQFSMVTWASFWLCANGVSDTPFRRAEREAAERGSVGRSFDVLTAHIKYDHGPLCITVCDGIYYYYY